MSEASLSKILNFKVIGKLFQDYALTSELDVALYDREGEEQLCVRRTGCICEYGKDAFPCREKIVSSGKKSVELKSAYIYETPCGLIMCITPLVFEEELLGYITTGPVILWDKDDYFSSEFSTRMERAGVSLKEKQFDISSIRQIDCKSMTAIAETLTMLVNYTIQTEQSNIRQRMELSKLSVERYRTVKEIQLHENQLRYNRYPIELEKELIACVQMGDKNQAKQIINRFLDEIFSYASGDLDVVKAKIYELTAFLSRSAVEAGAPVSSLTGVIRKSSKLLLENGDFFDICYGTVEVLDGFLDAVYASRGKKATSAHLYNAINYINNHYQEELNLKALADRIFVSTYYLSHLFRSEMGTTFSEYLTKVRINRAKELLMEGKTVEFVSEAVGYGEANYFIKIFKKHVGVTPSKYRKAVSE